MEKYCSELLSIMKLEIANYLIIAILCIIAIVVCAFLRADKKYRLLLWICFGCFIITVALSVNTITPIYKDYRDKSFIQLDNVTVISKTLGGFDLSGKAEISVQTLEGRVIRLTTTDQLPNGEYRANIVYAQRSNCLVEWEIME